MIDCSQWQLIYYLKLALHLNERRPVIIVFESEVRSHVNSFFRHNCLITHIIINIREYLIVLVIWFYWRYTAPPSKNAVSANIKHSRYIKHRISAQSTTVAKGCMYIWQMLPLVVEENWSSANFFRKLPM